MTNIPLCSDVARQLAENGGRSTALLDNVLLIGDVASLEQQDHQQRLSEIVDAAMKGFFHLSATGTEFCESSLTEQKLGQTLQARYPGASDCFYRLARTYWSLRAVWEHNAQTHHTCGDYVLAKVGSTIGMLFFHTNGSGLDPSLRADAQREMIESSGAPINIIEWLEGNPLIARDRIRNRLARESD